MILLLRLYWEFFTTGLFAIGGGLATLPFLYDMSASTGWFSVNDLSNMIAVSQSTPGPMGINMATYTGFVTAGIPGGIIAVMGIITPSIIIILLVSRILDRFKNNKYVQYALYGLRSASVALIAVAGLQVARAAFLGSEKYLQSASLTEWLNLPAIIFGVVLFFVYEKTKLHPIFYILASGVVGVLLGL